MSRLYRVPQAAEIISVSKSKAYELIRDGHLVASKTPGTSSKQGYRVSQSAIDDYISSLEHV